MTRRNPVIDEHLYIERPGRQGCPWICNHAAPHLQDMETRIRQLEQENARLRQGGCRFDCRADVREAFEAGFMYATHTPPIQHNADKGFSEWRASK